MREGAILMKGPMVRATLADVKTNTRRVVSHFDGKTYATDPDRVGEVKFLCGAWHFYPKQAGSAALPLYSTRCPYGNPGDRLWVRETFGYGPSAPFLRDRKIYYRSTADDAKRVFGEWKPSIHMPRWASRITLEIVKVRVERVQDISEADAVTEGVFRFTGNALAGMPEVECLDGRTFFYHPDTCAARVEFNTLWDSINAKRGFSWDDNPWVWVIEFKRVESEVARG